MLRSGGGLQRCAAVYRVAWSPAFGKYLCDECRYAATSIALAGVTPDRWASLYPSAASVRLG